MSARVGLNKIIYVGKAKSLRKRVRQYFSKSPKTIRIQKMVSQIENIEYIVTNNELEALVLECNYIKENMMKLGEVVYCGYCADICVPNVAIPTKMYFNEHNINCDVIVPENAIETLDIFVPLAYYIGQYRIKSELEDLSLRYLNPDLYRQISEEKNLSSSLNSFLSFIEKVLHCIISVKERSIATERIG